jgi:hypothetical protein
MEQEVGGDDGVREKAKRHKGIKATRQRGNEKGKGQRAKGKDGY